MGLQASRVGPLPQELQEDVLWWGSGGAAGPGGAGLSGAPVPGQALVGCECVCARVPGVEALSPAFTCGEQQCLPGSTPSPVRRWLMEGQTDSSDQVSPLTCLGDVGFLCLVSPYVVLSGHSCPGASYSHLKVT